MRKKIRKRSGFTLIQTIVVLAVMGTILGIVAPKFSQYVEQTCRKADIANLESLNRTTQIYRQIKLIPSGEDVFSDYHSDQECMQALCTEGLLDQIIEPQAQGNVFSWHRETQTWHLSPESGQEPGINDPPTGGGCSIRT